MFFLRPPEDLVEPVDAPVAENAVGEVEVIAEPAGMDAFVEGPQRSGTTIEIPVEIHRHRIIRRGRLDSTRTVGKGADHADLAGTPFLEKFHPADVVRADAAVHAYLHGALIRPRRLHHRPALEDGVAGRLFDKDVRTRLDAGDALEGVPMIRGRDDRDLDLFLLQHLPVVAVGRGQFPGEALDIVGRDLELVGIDIA